METKKTQEPDTSAERILELCEELDAIGEAEAEDANLGGFSLEEVASFARHTAHAAAVLANFAGNAANVIEQAPRAEA